MGSPPRRRGGLGRGCGEHDPVRLTPAQAGRTHQSWQAPAAVQAHPRAGGADGLARHHPLSDAGSPPRRRGGRVDLRRESGGDRLTPAQAGRTPQPDAPLATTPAHPRAGGADGLPGRAQTPRHGSPPRRRGGRRGLGRRPWCRRLTPAQAGRTAPLDATSPATTAHPRAGGADCFAADIGDGGAGSPPRRRGGLRLDGVRGGA